jgi:hypothetical protein
MGAGATVALAFGLIIIFGLLFAALAYTYALSRREEEE